MKNLQIFLFVSLLITAFGCKDEYDIPVKSTDQIVLVVDGFLNSNGLTTITLTNSFKLDDTAKLKPVLQAQVTVEGNNNTTFPLTHAGTGKYTAMLNLLPTQEYRLRIKTTNGKEYLSAFVPVKKSPPIDSISWKEFNGGVMVYANTHDPNNDTRYYRWDYQETWEINSSFIARYKFIPPDTIVERDLVNDDVFACWKNTPSTNIILGSSAQLQSDVIFEAPVAFIPPASEKLSVRYSILVKQYALEKKAYEYLKLMKTNSESLGTIFDPQPSEMKGNIQCVTNPEEPVIGFITVSDVQEKRIFIKREQLSNWGFFMFCQTVEISKHKDSIKANVPKPYLPYDAIFAPTNPNVIVGYLVSLAECVDCTKRGGSTTKPSFW